MHSISCKVLFLLLLIIFGNADCLAIASEFDSDSFNNSIRKKIVSTKKDGLSKTFSFFEEQQQQLEKEQQQQHQNQNQHQHQTRIQSRQTNNNKGSLIDRVQAGLRSTFLPSGYPKTTPPGYLKYAAWSWIQDLSTQLRGVLATQRVLEGVGVGREGATALSALMNFLVRDGCGMAANLLFTAVASSSFGSDVKRWRLFADIMVDIGITLEVAATIVPHAFFLPMISIGTMCKAICGVAAGACGGAINLFWAKGSDIADIQAKFGAQHTVTGSLGLVFAALFARSVSELPQKSLWSVYFLLTALHIHANRNCMRLISFESFNTPRLNIVVSDYLDYWAANQVKEEKPACVLPTPNDVAKVEPLLFVGPQPKIGASRILFGESFNELATVSGHAGQRLRDDANTLKQNGYVVVSGMKNHRPCVVVCLHTGCKSETLIKAYLHASLYTRQIAKSGEIDPATETAIGEDLNTCWPIFMDSCKKSGWDFNHQELRTQGYDVS